MGRRPDIDGLRAVAVSTVVLYHIGPRYVPGGFVGVDIFFVISGYLITALLLEDIRKERFSIGYFYERRIRRILPALFAVLLTSSIAAWITFFPIATRDYGLSLMATVSFWSNELFRSQVNYFHPAGTTFPLLHTWSLAVEEQFYIFYPLFLFLVSRYLRKRYAVAIGCVMLASFAWSVWRIVPDAQAIFYLAPGRAWELMLGGLLAIGVIPALRRPAAAHALGFLGLGLIGYSVFAFSSSTLFPGVNALFPCVGAALVIYSGTAAQPVTAWALSARPIVFVGLISYSLYLWHWIILVFTEYYLTRPLSRFEAVAVIVASLLAATLSWRFVENPFRGRGAICTRSALFAGTALIVLLFAAGGALAYFTNGLPNRYSSAVQTMAAGAVDSWSRWDRCKFNICRVGSQADDASFILWGDSHVGSLAPMVDREAFALNRSGVVAFGYGCAPLLQVKYSDSGFGDCSKLRSTALDYIAKHHIENVFLHARWGLYTDENPFDDLRKKKFAEFEWGLRSTLGELQRRKLNVAIIASVPEPRVDVPMVLARHSLSGLPETVAPLLSDIMRNQGHTLEALRRAADEYSVRIVYPHRVLCDTSTCLVTKDGWPLYMDESHLSTHGAMILAPMFTKLLRESGL